MSDLRDLLDLATDRVEPAGLAPSALATARRRRTARRSVVACAAVSALVAGVLVGTRLGGTAPVDPATAPTVPPSQVPTAPAIPADRIQPEWDPRDAESRPVVDLGVPRVMESLVPGAVERPVAILDDGTEVRLVSADGRSSEIDLPAAMTAPWRTVSLAPDGSRLAVAGPAGFFWRTLEGPWTSVEFPERQQATGEYPEVTWSPDSRSLVLRTHLAGVLVDLDTGESTVLPMLRGYVAWSFGPDGALVTTSLPAVREWQDGEVVGETALGELASLQRPVVSQRSVAAMRGDAGWYGARPSPADRDGLFAFDRGSLATRAFLPVVDRSTWYSDGGELSPVAWLDDDTVLFTVLPRGAAKRYLMTWDVETGEIARVSCWLSDVDAVFATDLLR